MQTIPLQLDAAFRAAIQSAFGLDADPLIAPSQNDKFGDYQSNAAMGLAKKVGQNPRAVAEQIKSRLELGEMASEVTMAGPGFLNVRLSPAWLAQQLQHISADPRRGVDPSSSQRVVIDYSGPNVAKQMHVGHLRPTNIGDALSRIIEFQGHPVTRQNHLGDWGTQFGMLLAYLKQSKLGSDAHIADLEDFYRQAKKRFDEDPAFAATARDMVVRLQSGQAEERALWQRIVEESRRHFQPLYDRMDILLRPEHERGESFYNAMLPQVVAELQQKNVAQLSEGAVVVFVQGFDAPLIIQKSNGGFGYGTTDLAAIRFRTNELHAQRIIYVTDARQIQHFRQVFDAARRAGWVDSVQLDHVTFGSILGEDGTPLKTRSGETVKLKDLLDQAEERAFAMVTEKNPSIPESQRRAIAHAVGIGAVKYYDLARDRTSDYVFSWEKMLSLDGNTAPYLQYAYARIRSIFRKAAETGAAPAPGATIKLQSPHELALAKHMLRLGEVLQLIERELKPHHLCGYLYELATRFSGFYENCPVLQSPEPQRSSRLLLCDLTASVLALGLDLLGIEHPEQM